MLWLRMMKSTGKLQTLSNDVMCNKLRTKLVCLQAKQPSLLSFLHLLRDTVFRVSLVVLVVLSKDTCSVLVQIEQKQTGDVTLMDPAGLMRHIWVDLWEMIWSVYRCNPRPPVTSRLSHGVWSHEEVNYCKELQEVLFLSTLKIIPKSARGRGCTILIDCHYVHL